LYCTFPGETGIAEKANVSPSAVSIALNNRKGISDKTRKRILKIVEKLDYVPNPQARRLLLKYTNNIGILHEEQKSPLRHLFLWDIFI
jgi:LacI family transcriptional regulator